MSEKLISMQEAREILGEKAKKMTDKEIDSLLAMLELICNKTIESVVKR